MSVYDEGCVQVGAAGPGEVAALRNDAAKLRKQGRSVEASALDDKADKIERDYHRKGVVPIKSSKRRHVLEGAAGAAVALAAVVGIGMHLRKKG